MASFLARFAAFRSFGVIVGCFLPSLFGLRSFDMLFAPYPYFQSHYTLEWLMVASGLKALLHHNCRTSSLAFKRIFSVSFANAQYPRSRSTTDSIGSPAM